MFKLHFFRMSGLPVGAALAVPVSLSLSLAFSLALRLSLSLSRPFCLLFFPLSPFLCVS